MSGEDAVVDDVFDVRVAAERVDRGGFGCSGSGLEDGDTEGLESTGDACVGIAGEGLHAARHCIVAVDD